MQNINLLLSIYGAANCAANFDQLKNLLNKFTFENPLLLAIDTDAVTVCTMDQSITVTFTRASFN